MPKYSYTEAHGDGWRAWMTVDGVRRRGKVRETRKEAHEDAVRMRAEQKAAERGQCTLDMAIELAKRVGRVKGNRPKTAAFYDHQFEILRRAFGGSTLMDRITHKGVLLFVEKRGREVGANTINHHLRALGRLFNVARKNGHPDLRNPVKDIERPSSEEPERHSYSWAEAQKHLAAIRESSQQDGDLVELFLRSGLRRSEVARLKGSDFDLEHKQLAVGAAVAKSRKGAVVPITKAWESVARRLAKSRGFIVPGTTEDRRVGWIVRMFRRCKKLLGVEVWRAHVMRHTLGTALGENDTPLTTIRDALRHSPKSAAITSRYVHGESEALKRALGELD